MRVSVFPKKRNYTFYLDLSPGSCGIALIEKSQVKTCVPKVLTTRRSSLSGTAHPETQLRSLKMTAEQMLNDCVREFSVHAYDIVVLVHSPFSSTQVFEHEKKFEKETMLTIDTITKIKQAYSHVENKDEQKKIIHSHLQTIFLNGYPTRQPVGKLAHTVGVTMVEDTLAMNFYVGVIEPLVGRARSVRLLGFSQLVGRLLSVNEKNERDFTFMSFGKMHTEIATYYSGTIKDSLTMHFGTYSLVESLARISAVPRESAETLLRLESKGTLSSEQVANLRRSEEECSKKFEYVLNETLKDTKLPKKTFFIQDSDWHASFKNVLASVIDPQSQDLLAMAHIDDRKLTALPTMDTRLIYAIHASLLDDGVHEELT